MDDARNRRWPAIFVTMLLVVVVCPWPVAAQTGGPSGYSFTLEVEGVVVGQITEISGLKMEVDVIEFKDGTSGEIRKFAGRTGWPEVIVTRRFTGNTELYDWANASRPESLTKRAVVITMVDRSGREIARWQLRNAWPAKWAGPVLDRASGEFAMESVALAHEGLTMSTEPR